MRIQRQGSINEEEFNQLLRFFFENITLVEESALLPFTERAMEIVASIDTKDVAFIACALAIGGELWSDDAALKRQDAVGVLNTEEMKQL